MARTITFTETMAANGFIAAQAEVDGSQFNPVERTSRVSLFAASSIAAVGHLSLKLGADEHASDAVLQTAPAVSTRDHLVASGVAFAGQKITVALRNSGAGAPIINGVIVIEPIG